MKGKGKSIVSLIIILLIIAGSITVALFGIDLNGTLSAQDIKLGLDLQGGASITYEVISDDITREKIDDTIHILQKRADNLSTEAEVYSEGTNRINVDIPGVEDADEALKGLGKAGKLEFIDENGDVVIDGSHVVKAQDILGTNSFNQPEPQIHLELNSEGAELFRVATKENIGKIIYIYFDGELVSNPVVNSEISGGVATITCGTMEQAEELASTIRSGALPVELQELRSNIVGAKLGADAINASVLAGAIGICLVIIFMIVMYKIPGLAAGLALLLYTSMMIIFINLFSITLTLPGIAGIILSIGMAVDANVIIFSRIAEELALEKTLRSSIKSGFNKATSAIIDGNITTLIAAFVLFLFGTGPIKGFASTLALGILLSMFTALVITRNILTRLMLVGFKDKKLYSYKKNIKMFDFVSKRKIWFGISIVIILIGFGGLGLNQVQEGDVLNYDIEFKGGTSTVVTFENELSDDEIEDSLKPLVTDATGETNPQTQTVTGTNQVIIKTKTLDEAERTVLDEALIEEYNITAQDIERESISATISNEMKREAIIALLIAAVLMLVYITFRFKDVLFGTAAVMALIHDILIVLAVYAVLRIPVNNSFIAAMLTIVGYSINDSIVLFDRVRENKGFMKHGDYKGLVNSSINQTIGRSINTSITTFVMIALLLIVGFNIASLRQFALPLMVGILSGTYSSIFIASPLWYTFTKRKQAKQK